MYNLNHNLLNEIQIISSSFTFLKENNFHLKFEI